MEPGEADQIINSMDHCRHCFDVVGTLELHIFVANKCRAISQWTHTFLLRRHITTYLHIGRLCCRRDAFKSFRG